MLLTTETVPEEVETDEEPIVDKDGGGDIADGGGDIADADGFENDDHDVESHASSDSSFDGAVYVYSTDKDDNNAGDVHMVSLVTGEDRLDRLTVRVELVNWKCDGRAEIVNRNDSTLPLLYATLATFPISAINLNLIPQHFIFYSILLSVYFFVGHHVGDRTQ